MRLSKIFLLLLIFRLSPISAYGQIHFVQKGQMKIGIKVTLNDQVLAIDSLSDSFNPRTGVPEKLVIPEGSSLGFVPDSLGDDLDIALLINNERVTGINQPNKKMNEFSVSSSAGSENSYVFIDKKRQDTLEITWQVGYNKVELADLYPAGFFKNYVALQIKYIFESYPDSSQYDWKSKKYIDELNDRGLPVNPRFPYNENGLYFVVDQLVEGAEVQLIGYHSAPQALNQDDPFALFLYEDLKPGNYEFMVWPYKNAPDSITLRYPFSISKPWWMESVALVLFTFLGAVLLGLILFLYYRSAQRRKTRELQWAQQLTQAELKAIRAQLNPHFLFNSLNSIQNLVSQGKNDLANSYLRKLSKFLSRVLSVSEKQFHELDQEIELTELYLELEKLRFSFSSKIKVSNDVELENLVPVMLLQPYVENAVKHGVASKGEDGEIQILIFRDGEFLKIEILDNGPGLSEPNESSAGIHLGNARIKNLNHIYSKEASVEISSREDQRGVRVFIKLPIE
jgi:two-component sensor histidine kinase